MTLDPDILGLVSSHRAARYVKAYLKTHKNDWNDAAAIAEAVTMRFVEVKSINQQAILHLHRSRQLYVRHRTGLIDHVHSILAEYGVVFNRARIVVLGKPQTHCTGPVIVFPLRCSKRWTRYLPISSSSKSASRISNVRSCLAPD